MSLSSPREKPYFSMSCASLSSGESAEEPISSMSIISASGKSLIVRLLPLGNLLYSLVDREVPYKDGL